MASFLSRALRIVPLLVILCASVVVNAETTDQVLVETWMIRLGNSKIPSDIRSIALPSSQPKEPYLLTAQQQDNLLKAAGGCHGQVIASPTFLALAGSEAEIRTVQLRPYLASMEPPIKHSVPMYAPSISDTENGLTLKVKAEPSADGKSVRLTFSPKLRSLLDLQTFTFETPTAPAMRVAIQQPINQEISLDTMVSVPNGRTIVLGGQTVGKSSDAQTLLFLVRPTILSPDALPKGDLPANTAIAVQTKFLSVPSDFPPDFRKTYLSSNQPPILDDARAEAMLKAVQSSVGSSIVTAPPQLLSNGDAATTACTRPVPYVGTFSLHRDSAGKRAYTPQIASLDKGHVVKLRATPLPERNAATVSADITVTDLLAMNIFTFIEKPEKVTVQQPNRQVISANLQANIPDKHWLVIGPLTTTGRVETDVRPSVISRLFGGKPRRKVSFAQRDLYILIRPEAQVTN